MRHCVLLGVLCLVGYSLGQLPPRPTAFAGASQSGEESPRQIVVRRPISRRRQDIVPQTDAPQAARQIQRRPQPLGRARTNFIEDERPYVKPNLEVPKPRPTTTPQPQKLTPKPVSEDEYYDDEEYDEETNKDSTPPSISRAGYVGPFQPQLNHPPPAPFQRPAFLQPSAFRPVAPPAPIILQKQQQLPQHSFRPTPVILPIQPSPSPTPQRPITRQPIAPSFPVRPTPVVSVRPPPQQLLKHDDEEEEDDEPQYVRQQPKPVQQYRPAPQVNRQQTVTQPKVAYKQHPSKASNSERKPVSQTIRKYHVENEDGSITWGYENDDGSFKEETIGVDCVTRGKYGYVDPDGVKREYTYQTGIPCDRDAQEAEQAASANEGYIDYTNNKYIFPNGDEIDLESMVKNRARKPVGKYRN